METKNAKEKSIEEKLENILIIEDTEEFGKNALEAYKNNDRANAVLAGTFQEALNYLTNQQFNYIISDVQFPENQGSEARDNTKKMLELAEEHFLPLAFVTRANHHGYLEMPDGITIITLNPAKIYMINKEKINDFRDLSHILRNEFKEKDVYHNIYSNIKTVEIYKSALEQLKKAIEDKEDAELMNALKRKNNYLKK